MNTNIEVKNPLLAKSLCPDPLSVTLDATVANVVTADFNSAQLANYGGALGSTNPNKAYAHTFVWKPKTRCCQVTSATLEVKMKSLQSGASSKSSDSGNDRIAIVGSGGIALAPFNELVYNPASYPFPGGTLSTKTWTLTGSQLNSLNTAHTLSFFVQDDTSVLSATLHLIGCCLEKIS